MLTQGDYACYSNSTDSKRLFEIGERSSASSSHFLNSSGQTTLLSVPATRLCSGEHHVPPLPVFIPGARADCCHDARFSLKVSNAKITTPKEFFGFNIGDDYQLPTYTQIEAYYKTLASESDRIKLIDIGPTEEGRRQYLMIVTSPENMKQLEHYRGISERLAHGEGLTDEQAHALANEGKAVVWIDGSIHATETPSTDQLVETAYQLASRNDPETLRILDNDIVLLAHTNPDGVEKVAEWYMRNPKPEDRAMQMLPELHKKFIGQEDNRDFFMMTMKESQNLNKILYLQWFPQILYNHHGASYPGAVIAAQVRIRDPFSTRYDPLVMTELDSLTSAMNNRWEAENMPSALERDSVPYSTWYNGSIRTTGYYHNVVGILTEIMGGPNPTWVTLVPDRLLAQRRRRQYFPPAPADWHYRQTIDYLITANYAVMRNYAARNRDDVLFNMYRMAKNSIDRGKEDYWTIYPKRVTAIKAAYEADLASGNGASATGPARTGRMASFAANALRPIPSKYYDMVMKNPELQRSARIHHHQRRPARFSDGREICECVDWRRRASRESNGAVHGEWQVLSGRILCCKNRSSLQASRAGYV